ncbi:hypothetical protein [Halostreptopolyspora alba]|uniref:hypothetical protein n=1 Tax=Halostreptopolyspora alba TaxID=2487137 RepID=UPI0011CE50B9
MAAGAQPPAQAAMAQPLLPAAAGASGTRDFGVLDGQEVEQPQVRCGPAAVTGGKGVFVVGEVIAQFPGLPRAEPQRCHGPGQRRRAGLREQRAQATGDRGQDGGGVLLYCINVARGNEGPQAL